MSVRLASPIKVGALVWQVALPIGTYLPRYLDACSVCSALAGTDKGNSQGKESQE